MSPQELCKRCEETFDVKTRTLRFLWTEEVMSQGSGTRPEVIIAGRTALKEGTLEATVVPLLNTRRSNATYRWYNAVRPTLHLSASAVPESECTSVSIRTGTSRYLHAWIIGALVFGAAGLLVVLLGGVLRAPVGLFAGMFMLMFGVGVVAITGTHAGNADLGYRVLADWFDHVVGTNSVR